jgi:hypothetical protein
MSLPDFFPKTDERLNIGDANGPLLVGHSFDRSYEFTAFDGDTCSDEPVDFTGFFLIAEVVDADDAVLETFTVDPNIGDPEGAFELHLDPAQVTTALRDNAVKWKFRMVDGGVTNELLIYADFTVT